MVIRQLVKHSNQAQYCISDPQSISLSFSIQVAVQYLTKFRKMPAGFFVVLETSFNNQSILCMSCSKQVDVLPGVV